MIYTYSIFDGDPTQSGQCVWPDHDDVEVEAETADVVLAQALRIALRQAEQCGEYEAGDTLYVLVWDENNILVRSGAGRLAND